MKLCRPRGGQGKRQGAKGPGFCRQHCPQPFRGQDKPSPLRLSKTQDWLNEPQTPPPVVCGSQRRWANKIRCYLFFLAVAIFSPLACGIRRIRIQTRGHVPSIRTPVTSAGYRDRSARAPRTGQEPGLALYLVRPLMSWGSTQQGHWVPGRWPALLICSGPCPGGVVEMGSWNSCWRHSCGNCGGLVGITARCQ